MFGSLSLSLCFSVLRTNQPDKNVFIFIGQRPAMRVSALVGSQRLEMTRFGARDITHALDAFFRGVRGERNVVLKTVT